MVRIAILIGAGAAILAVAGCAADGGGGAPAPNPRMRLEITSPSDGATVRRGTIDVRGRVRPSTADVRVLGRPALVSRGSFTVVVPLHPGVNVVDVAASARDRRPALAAFRVTREQRVRVPDLAGVDVDELAATLRPLGLDVEVQEGGGVLDRFLPLAPAVCEQEPEAGTRVRRGATVRVVVARTC